MTAKLFCTYWVLAIVYIYIGIGVNAPPYARANDISAKITFLTFLYSIFYGSIVYIIRIHTT